MNKNDFSLYRTVNIHKQINMVHNDLNTEEHEKRSENTRNNLSTNWCEKEIAWNNNNNNNNFKYGKHLRWNKMPHPKADESTKDQLRYGRNSTGILL